MTFFQVRFSGTIPGEIFQFGFTFDSPGTAQDLANSINTNFGQLWLTQATRFPVTTVFGSVFVQEFNPATGQLGVDQGSTTLGLPGAVTGPLPNEVALVVSLRTPAGLPTGRFYLPPLAKGEVDNNGLMNVGGLTDLADKLDTFFTNIKANPAGGSLLVWHRPRPNAVPPVPGSTSIVDTIDLGNVFDSQRRRRNKQIEARQSRAI